MRARVVSLVTDPPAIAVLFILALASCSRSGSVTILPENPRPGEVVIVELPRNCDASQIRMTLDDKPAKIVEAIDSRHVGVIIPSLEPGTHTLSILAGDRTVATSALETREAMTRALNIVLDEGGAHLASAGLSAESWSGHAPVGGKRIAVDLVATDGSILFSTTLIDVSASLPEIIAPAGAEALSFRRGRVPDTAVLIAYVPNLQETNTIRVYRVPRRIDATQGESRKAMTLLGEFPAHEEVKP
ncbi:MAG: hypothetical protein OEX18_05605 [Candidatus Krumholzibacteria bacterium]|nr:hypothetical protein [Candidatus Krumholzibacteria bacterium]